MAERDIATSRRRLLSSSELAAFCLQVSIILKSGIPLHDGLELMHEDLSDQRLKTVLKTVSDTVTDRKSLHAALIKAAVFPDYMVAMVRIGADSGKLDVVMSSLSAFYEREDAVRQNIRSAVVYPMALIVMMLIVMMVLSMKVLPVFSEVFKGLGTTMSPAASAIMNFGLAAGKYSVVLLLCAALLFAFVYYLFRTDQGARLLTKLTARGKLSEKIAVARFASSMALMLASGLDTEHALKMSVELVTNNKVKGKIQQCMALVDGNKSFVDALYSVSLFPKITSRMLSLGFKAGTMDTVMHKVADTYEAEVEAALIKRVSLIEPVSVAFLTIIIGIILISVMLPLMSVMSSIG